MDHGLAGLDEGGKVEDAVEGLTVFFGCDEKAFKGSAISKFTLDEIHSRWQQIAPAVAQIVINNGLMSALGQQTGDCTTYVPRTASNQYLHKKNVLSRTLWFTLSLLHR
jgi:hypothetical protein